MSERCQHSSCYFDNRPEYCFEKAAESTGVASEVVGLLGCVLWAGKMAAGEFTASLGSQGKTIDRKISYPSGAAKITVQIHHEEVRTPPHSIYDIDVSWSLNTPESPPIDISSSYSIEAYPDGPTFVTVEPPMPSHVDDGRETHRATPYDLDILLRQLDTLRVIQQAE